MIEGVKRLTDVVFKLFELVEFVVISFNRSIEETALEAERNVHKLKCVPTNQD